jgi:uncharacterized protein
MEPTPIAAPDPPDAPEPATATLPFFAFALGFTWLLQLPSALVQRGLVAGELESVLGLAALGSFGPLLAALLFARRAPGGARGLLRQLLRWRVGGRWYAVAILVLPATYVAAAAVYKLAGGQDAAWLYPPENAQHLAALALIPLVEEIGWRGYALPRLQRRYGAHAATLLLGVGWALWHVMMFLLATTTATAFSVAMVNILVGSVLFTWLYNRTGGSLLLAVLLHAGAHLNNPAHAMPDPTPLAIYTAGLAVVAAALLLFDRRAWPPAGAPAMPAST